MFIGSLAGNGGGQGSSEESVQGIWVNDGAEVEAQMVSEIRERR